MSKSHRQREFDKVMCVLGRAHSLFPELRIGQLIVNSLGSVHVEEAEKLLANNPDDWWAKEQLNFTQSLFYLTDEQFFNCLKEFCNNARK